MEKKQTKHILDDSEKESRIYEVSYLIRADIGEPAVLQTVAEKITAFFELKNVRILSEGIPEYTDLAYEIRKDINNKKERFTEAAFGWVKFESDPTFIKDLNEHLDLVKNIIRFLVVKTTEENTVLLRRERRDVEGNEDISESDIPDTLEVPEIQKEEEVVVEVEKEVSLEDTTDSVTETAEVTEDSETETDKE
jgi:ribosomal protein S6